MSNNEVQTIYISLDDSGKLNKNEDVCVYAGMVFLSKKEKDKFITKYKAIVSEIKCKYCKKSIDSCNKSCPELKHNNLDAKHLRRLIGLVKKYYAVGCLIDNQKVYDRILESKAARGRYSDYVIRRTVKSLFQKLIREGKINPYKPVKLIINMDEQTTKSNGYYSLEEGIYEELKNGIRNYDYGFKPNPILFSDFDLKLMYQHSDKSYVIQAADLVAGTIRRDKLRYYNNPELLIEILNTFVYHIEYMP